MDDSSDVTLVQSDTSPVCKHFQTGFCKFADKCKRRHEKEMCPLTQCSSKTCRKRHPKLCKFFSLRGFCKFGDLCCYKHLNAESQKTPHLISEMTALQTKVDEMEQLIKTLQSEIVALKNINKCEVCDYVASSSTTLKAHISKNHKHTSEAAPLERERSQINDTSLNASLPSEERLENTQLNNIASDDFEDDPQECDWGDCTYVAYSNDDMDTHIQIAHMNISSFVFPPSSEEILCPYDDCGEEFFLDQSFAMHVYDMHNRVFKCDHCHKNIRGGSDTELLAIHMKMCSISCTNIFCSLGNPLYYCPGSS